MAPRKLRSVPKPPSPAEALSNVRLTADRLLVRVPEDGERRSKAGLLIPATAAVHAKKGVWSEVVLTGPEVRHLKAGDRVLFILQSALEVDVESDTFMLLRERDIQAVSSDRTDPTTGQYL